MTTIIHSPVLGIRAAKLAPLYGANLGQFDTSLLGPDQRFMLIERWPHSDETWVSFHASLLDALAHRDTEMWDLGLLVDLVSGVSYGESGRQLATIVADPDVVGGEFGDVIALI